MPVSLGRVSHHWELKLGRIFIFLGFIPMHFVWCPAVFSYFFPLTNTEMDMIYRENPQHIRRRYTGNPVCIWAYALWKKLSQHVSIPTESRDDPSLYQINFPCSCLKRGAYLKKDPSVILYSLRIQCVNSSKASTPLKPLPRSPHAGYQFTFMLSLQIACLNIMEKGRHVAISN